MNPQYFERYSGYITAPFIATIVGIAMFVLAIAIIITSVCLFGNKSKALYAVNKAFSITGLIVSILLTVAYTVIIALVALSTELFAYNGAGFIGATRDFACGIFLAPAKFGVSINSTYISTSIPFIFYTITVFAPAVLGYIGFIISCIACRSSAKARRTALQTPQNVAVKTDNTDIKSQPVETSVIAPAPEVQTEEAVAEQGEETATEQVEETAIEQAEETPAEQIQSIPDDAPRFCINCGTALNGGAFCINCGTPAKKKNNLCKNCNAELAKDALFCRECGTKIE